MGQQPKELHPYVSARDFFGAELRRLRERAGLSQDELGRRAHFSGDLVAKVEKAVRVPSRAFVEACEGVLQSDGVLLRLLGLVRTQSEGRPAGTAVTAAGSPEALSVAGALSRPDEGARLVQAEGVAAVRAVLEGCRRLDHSAGPRAALETVASQLRLVESLAGSSGGSRRDALLVVLGELYQLSGWMRFDLQDLAGARAALAAARRAARQVEDATLTAYVLGPNLGFVETDLGRAQDGVELSYAAQGWARRSGNERLLAFVLAIGARAHARLGEERLCLRLLDEAAEALARHDGAEEDPVWLEVFDRVALLGHRGSCLLDLDRAGDAVALLEAQDAGSAELFVRNRAIWRLDLARAYRALGEVEQACAQADQALELVGATSSARTRQRVRALGASLAPWQQTPVVHTLFERMAHLGATG